MEGSDNKRAVKCVENWVGWLRLNGLDTTHLKKNSWNAERHSEAIKGTQLRRHSKSLMSRNGTLHGKVHLLRPMINVRLGWPGFSC